MTLGKLSARTRIPRAGPASGEAHDHALALTRIPNPHVYMTFRSLILSSAHKVQSSTFLAFPWPNLVPRAFSLAREKALGTKLVTIPPCKQALNRDNCETVQRPRSLKKHTFIKMLGITHVKINPSFLVLRHNLLKTAAKTVKYLAGHRL